MAERISTPHGHFIEVRRIPIDSIALRPCASSKETRDHSIARLEPAGDH